MEQKQNTTFGNNKDKSFAQWQIETHSYNTILAIFQIREA